MEGSSSVNCKVYKITQAYLKGALQCKKKKMTLSFKHMYNDNGFYLERDK